MIALYHGPGLKIIVIYASIRSILNDVWIQAVVVHFMQKKPWNSFNRTIASCLLLPKLKTATLPTQYTCSNIIIYWKFLAMIFIAHLLIKQHICVFIVLNATNIFQRLLFWRTTNEQYILPTVDDPKEKVKAKTPQLLTISLFFHRNNNERKYFSLRKCVWENTCQIKINNW